MCGCINNPCGCGDTPELPYLTGTNGTDGKFGGFSGIWKFDDTTAGNPSSGYLKMNNVLGGAVTEIKVHDNDSNGVSHDAFLDSFDNSGSYGRIRIFKEYDETKHWMGEITNVVDNGAFHTLTVTWIQHNGSISLNDEIVLTFTPNGADGAAGSSAATKSYVLESFIDGPLETITTGTNGTFSTVLTLPQGELVQNGDIMLIEHLLEITADSTKVDIIIDGNLLESYNAQEGWLLIKMEVSKIAPTFIHITLTINNSAIILSPNLAIRTNDFMYADFMAVSNMNSNALVFEIDLPSNVPGDVHHIKSNSKIMLK